MADPTAAEVFEFVVVEDHSQIEASEHFAISRSKVQRLLKGVLNRGRLREVDELGDALGDLDATGRARLGVLRTLAKKLDWAERANTAGAAIALAGLSKQFLDLLEVLAPVADETKGWLQWTIFPPDHVMVMRDLMERIVDGVVSGDDLVVQAQRAVAMAQEFDLGDGSTSRFKPANDWGFNA